MLIAPAPRGESLGRFLGALIAFLAPGAAVVGAAVLVGSPGGPRITGGEWVTACVAAIVASAAIDAQVTRKVKQEEERLARAAAAPPPPEVQA